MFFEDVPGTRVEYVGSKEGALAVASGTVVRRLEAFVPDNMTITKIVGISSTVFAGTSNGKFSLKVFSISLIGATATSKGLAQVSGRPGAGKKVFIMSGLTITVPSARILGFGIASLGAAGTAGAALKVFVHYNKGFNS